MNDYPPDHEMAKNLVKEIVKTGKNAVRGLPVFASAEVGFLRFEICESCEKYDAEHGRCKECGCFMRKKTKLAGASCPLGKWESMV